MKLRVLYLLAILLPCCSLQSVGEVDHDLVSEWKGYFDKNPWQELIKDRTPIQIPGVSIYELRPNPLDRPSESVAICTYKANAVELPHYHSDGVDQVCLVLEGNALVVVASEEQLVKKGDVIVVPTMNAYFTKAETDFVIVCIVTPPYTQEVFHLLTESNEEVGFDLDQFKNLLLREIKSQGL